MSIGEIAIAARIVAENAYAHADYQPRPDFAMLAQEVLELSLSLRGKHEHPVEYELVQIGAIVLNWLADIEKENDGKVTHIIVPPKCI